MSKEDEERNRTFERFSEKYEKIWEYEKSVGILEKKIRC